MVTLKTQQNLGINELFHRKEIAKKLVYAAMNKFDNITECNFRTYSNYNFINELYNNHGCVKTETILVNPITLEIVTDPTSSNATLISFNDYSFTIKK